MTIPWFCNFCIYILMSKTWFCIFLNSLTMFCITSHNPDFRAVGYCDPKPNPNPDSNPNQSHHLSDPHRTVLYLQL